MRLAVGMSCLFFILGLNVRLSAQPAFLAPLQKALQHFSAAGSLEQSQKALETLEELAASFSQDWQVQYWTAFVTTQVARQKAPADRPAMMDRAQLHLDLSSQRQPEGSARVRSDHFALQYLIDDFRAGSFWAAGDQLNGMKYNLQANEALGKAIKADLENPRTYLLSGTKLISDSRRTQDSSLMLAGKLLLQEAQELFQRDDPPAGFPDWGRGWISFWLTQTDLDN